MTLYPSIIAFYALFTVSVLFALAKGGWPERLGAAAYLALASVQIGVSFILPFFYDKVDGVGFFADLLSLAAFGAIALSAKRIWPLWAASLQLLAIASHFARWAQIAIEPYVYSLMKTVPTASTLVAMAVGTYFHQRRLKKFGYDPDWVNWKAASATF